MDDSNPLEKIYVPFPGKIVEQMRILRAQGFEPTTFASAMDLRRSTITNKELEVDWIASHIHTRDAIISHPDKSYKLVLDCQDAVLLDSQSDLVNGRAFLTERKYNSLKGLKLTPQQVKRFTSYDLTSEQILDNPFWNYLARNPDFFRGEFDFRDGDPDRLAAYVDFVFSKSITGAYGCKRAMGIYLGSSQKVPIMNLACLGGINDASRIRGGRLDEYSGNLIGESRVGKHFEIFFADSLTQLASDYASRFSN